jgi:glucose/arabinose dehydrogenase
MEHKARLEKRGKAVLTVNKQIAERLRSSESCSRGGTGAGGDGAWGALAAVLSAIALAVALALVAILPPEQADASVVPQGFQESVVLSGLNQPTSVEFAGDGRVFVAEKSGLIKVFSSLDDATPTTFADLRTKVHDWADRGLLGMALDPDFPTRPYVYALYTYNKAPGNPTVPRWPDACPTPPGGYQDGCVVTGRLSRLEAAGDTMTGSENVLIEDWCQQFSTHSVGSLAFGPGRVLYVSGGEGAGFREPDYGQFGGSPGSPTPKNPCGDPPTGVGGSQTPPTAEGGALRSQDLRTGGDPVGLSGSILRVDPDTGAALPDNPLAADADPNARRIVAHGLRNPYRITMRPGTGEVWVGDVGSGKFEEVNRLANPTGAVRNFGWPCYEGAGRNAAYDNKNLNICENLYAAAGAVTPPHYAYSHGTQASATDPVGLCQSTSGATNVGSSISGIAFYGGGSYPDRYDGALFFADYARGCIWTMFEGTDGQPDPATRSVLANGVTPVELQIGPGGDLFYADIASGTIRRVRYFDGNQLPTARATASPDSGPIPLTVNFDGTTSSDPENGPLAYAWDLDGDGAYDDSTAAKPSFTYDTAGEVAVGLRVTDNEGATDVLDEPLIVSPGNAPPSPTIASPLSTLKFKVGQGISFSGSATDPEEGTLPASALSWTLIVHHCASGGNCHEHTDETFPGVASGSFVAPDHGYPFYLELRLTATDSGGRKSTTSVRLNPQTVRLTFASNPTGLRLLVGAGAGTTTFSRTFVVGSNVTVEAPSPQTRNGVSYAFRSWSDGGAQRHTITAPGAARTYTATYGKTSTATTVKALSPAPGTRIKDRTPTVRAAVYEEQGILTKSDIRFYLDGRQRSTFSYDPTTNRLSYAQPSRLATRKHTVKVVASDDAGNVSARRWGFEVLG